MITVCKNNTCNGCMACVDKCPKKCISISDNIFYFNAVKDMNDCINCGICESVCPNNTIINKYMPREWKQGWGAPKIRQYSSSGGAASSIIQSFIQSGGYVASCLFKNGQFVFDLTNDMDIAKQFAGSKYIKSNPGGIYKKISERLKTNKVLFIGLPCQVAAAKNFVNNNENLYTVDLICHGTPSPKLLAKYLDEKRINQENCSDIKFRSNSSMGLVIDNRRLVTEGLDDYILTFLDGISYTENCYNCQFASFDRVADVTLGDSWGTEYKDEEEKGVSLILIQTEKGKEIVYNSELELKDVDIEKAKKVNHQLMHPSIRKPEREKFLSLIDSGKSFSFSTFILYKNRIVKRNIKNAIYSILHHTWIH